MTDKTQDVLGTPDELIEKCIDDELKTYTAYANGEVYYFTLYNDDGSHADSCCGFYDIEDIREHLPKSFKDEDLNNYFTHD